MNHTDWQSVWSKRRQKKTYRWRHSTTHNGGWEDTREGRQGTVKGETRKEPQTANTHHKKYQHQLRGGEGGDQRTHQKLQMNNALRIISP